MMVLKYFHNIFNNSVWCFYFFLFFILFYLFFFGLVLLNVWCLIQQTLRSPRNQMPQDFKMWLDCKYLEEQSQLLLHHAWYAL